eukprot:g2494.t1
MALSAPIAEKRPHRIVFGKVEGENRGEKPFAQQRFRSDPYFWLRDDDRKNEEILQHLRDENAFTVQQTSHLEGLRKTLYAEHLSHLRETDSRPSVPYGAYHYYTRTVEGLSYKLHCRKPGAGADDEAERTPSDDAEEHVYLDENKLAEGKSHCDVSAVRISPSHRLVAYGVDYKGDETYRVVIRDVTSGKDTADVLEATSGSMQWGKDESTIYYLTQDKTKRPYKLWRHTLGQPQSSDTCLLTEEDEQFWLGLGKSKSGRFIFAHSGSSETTEISFIDLDAEEASRVVFQERTFGLRYDVEHLEQDTFILWTNKDGAINRRLMTCPVSSTSSEHWQEMIPYDPSRKIDDVEIFSKHIVLEGRQGGLTQVWVLDKANDKNCRLIEFPEEIFEVCVSANKNYSTRYLRLQYSSLTTPKTWFDYDMASAEFIKIKQEDVLDFDADAYVCHREFAKAADGTQIPMSIVRRKDAYGDDADGAEKRRPLPCMLYGYGSYGISIDPCFHRYILPYLDRGMAFCIAHIRGGGEMGRYWYEEQGKYLNKRNTFSDFISCAEHLIDEGFTTASTLACEGRSAGGLLMGNVANMRPDLWRVVVAGVPFVDLMNTMCDPSIPLTTGEWEEWGNPNEDKYFDYMLSYSPYDNVREQPYPDIFITAGLYDPRVAYWEPTKWATKLRTMATNKCEILLKMDLDSGHFSASDRYKYIREKVHEQAYVLDRLGLATVPRRK